MAKRIRSCGQNWSEHETALLITLVEKCNGIWNPNVLRVKKNTGPVWEEIANQLGRVSKECAQKWTALRTYYRKELKKEQTNAYVCNWRHKDAMAFYLPYLNGQQQPLIVNATTEQQNLEIEYVSKLFLLQAFH